MKRPLIPECIPFVLALVLVIASYGTPPPPAFKPSVGAIVHYYADGDQTKPLAALVVGVNDEFNADLRVFPNTDAAPPFYAKNVQNVVHRVFPYWEWPKAK